MAVVPGDPPCNGVTLSTVPLVPLLICDVARPRIARYAFDPPIPTTSAASHSCVSSFQCAMTHCPAKTGPAMTRIVGEYGADGVGVSPSRAAQKLVANESPVATIVRGPTSPMYLALMVVAAFDWMMCQSVVTSQPPSESGILAMVAFVPFHCVVPIEFHTVNASTPPINDAVPVLDGVISASSSTRLRSVDWDVPAPSRIQYWRFSSKTATLLPSA